MPKPEMEHGIQWWAKEAEVAYDDLKNWVRVVEAFSEVADQVESVTILQEREQTRVLISNCQFLRAIGIKPQQMNNIITRKKLMPAAKKQLRDLGQMVSILKRMGNALTEPTLLKLIPAHDWTCTKLEDELNKLGELEVGTELSDVQQLYQLKRIERDRELLDLDDSDLKVRSDLAEALLMVGRTKESMEELETVLASDPEQPDALLVRALHHVPVAEDNRRRMRTHQVWADVLDPDEGGDRHQEDFESRQSALNHDAQKICEDLLAALEYYPKDKRLLQALLIYAPVASTNLMDHTTTESRNQVVRQKTKVAEYLSSIASSQETKAVVWLRVLGAIHGLLMNPGDIGLLDRWAESLVRADGKDISAYLERVASFSSSLRSLHPDLRDSLYARWGEIEDHAERIAEIRRKDYEKWRMVPAFRESDFKTALYWCERLQSEAKDSHKLVYTEMRILVSLMDQELEESEPSCGECLAILQRIVAVYDSAAECRPKQLNFQYMEMIHEPIDGGGSWDYDIDAVFADENSALYTEDLLGRYEDWDDEGRIPPTLNAGLLKRAELLKEHCPDSVKAIDLLIEKLSIPYEYSF